MAEIIQKTGFMNRLWPILVIMHLLNLYIPNCVTRFFVGNPSILCAIIRSDQNGWYRGKHETVGGNYLRSEGILPDYLKKLRRARGIEGYYESGATRPVRIAYRTRPATSWMFKRFINSPR